MSSVPHFTPWVARHRPCWHCACFDGMGESGAVAYCRHASAARVRSMPADGCSAFSREVGADDEPGPPDLAAQRVPVSRAGSDLR